jgi:hypothetical protein
MDQARVLVDANMDFHPIVELIALLDLVHLRIPLLFFIFNGAGGCDQGGIDDRALMHLHAPSAGLSLYCFKDLLAQTVFLQQLSKRQDRRFIRDPGNDLLDTRKAEYGGTSIRASSIAGTHSD